MLPKNFFSFWNPNILQKDRQKVQIHFFFHFSGCIFYSVFHLSFFFFFFHDEDKRTTYVGLKWVL